MEVCTLPVTSSAPHLHGHQVHWALDSKVGGKRIAARNLLYGEPDRLPQFSVLAILGLAGVSCRQSLVDCVSQLLPCKSANMSAVFVDCFHVHTL